MRFRWRCWRCSGWPCVARAGSEVQARIRSERLIRPARCGASESTQRIFTDDEWGDYLVYTRWPRAATSFLATAAAISTAGTTCEKWMGVINVKYDWQETLDAATASTRFSCPRTRRWRRLLKDPAAGASSTTTVSPSCSGRPRSAAGSGEQTSTRQYRWRST